MSTEQPGPGTSQARHARADFDLGLSWRQRDRLAALRRRRDHLATRVANYEPGGNPSRDKHELSALNWAIRIIENAAMAGVLKEVE
jgi:hypothetical protein